MKARADWMVTSSCALAIVSQPWLIAVGVACIGGAWLYTGGSKPYGYLGLGEVAVFLFFGLVAVLGTQYTQALRIDWVVRRVSPSGLFSMFGR